MNTNIKPIAGRAADVAARLRAETQSEAIYKALTMLLAYGPEDNVVVEFRYPGTKREHVVVQPCHIVRA
jgi:hypothetical protein